MTRSIFVNTLSPEWAKSVSRIQWTGLSHGDYIERGFIVKTSGRGILLGVLACLKADETGERFFTLAVNPSARYGAQIAESLAKHLPTPPMGQRNWVLLDSPEFAALSKRGCQVIDSGGLFEIPLQQVDERLARLRVILERKRPLKDGQRVVSWRSELGMEIRRIALAEKLAYVAQIDSLLTPNTPESLCPFATMLAFDGERLVGFFLARIRGEICDIPVRWVAAAYRQSWVNARLMMISLEAGRPHHPQVTHLHFRGDDDVHRETHQLCQRFGGSTVSRCVRFGLASG